MIPAFGRDFGNAIAALAQVLPEGMEISCPRIASGHPDDGDIAHPDRFVLLGWPRCFGDLRRGAGPHPQESWMLIGTTAKPEWRSLRGIVRGVGLSLGDLW
jgi:hypothetical protein